MEEIDEKKDEKLIKVNFLLLINVRGLTEVDVALDVAHLLLHRFYLSHFARHRDIESATPE